jgi:hypothetical protein
VPLSSSLPPSPSPFLSFLSTVFRIPFTCPSSYLLRTLLPSRSSTFKLRPKQAVTGRQENMSVMLRIKLLNPLSFCMVNFALSKAANILIRNTVCEIFLLPAWFYADLRLKYV